MSSNESEIRALLDSRVEACRAKDIDRLMSHYSPDIVYFDCEPLFRASLEAMRYVRPFAVIAQVLSARMSRLHICSTRSKETLAC